MLTECPACQTRYDIDAALLRRRGRRIRCSACGERWFMAAMAQDEHESALRPAAPAPLPPVAVRPEISIELSPLPDAAPAFAAPPVLPPLRARIGTAPRVGFRWRPRLSAGGMAMAATLGCIALMMGAVAQRERIVRHVPQSAPVFAAVGLPVNLRGLEFREVKSTLLTEGDKRTLAIEGVIAQVGPRDAHVPDVRLAVRDPSGREIYTWTAPAPRPNLGRGETVAFRARLAAPPKDGAQIKLRFAEAGRLTD
jgi:predicted Zn finger-like uncharacterized protein